MLPCFITAYIHIRRSQAQIEAGARIEAGGQEDKSLIEAGSQIVAGFRAGVHRQIDGPPDRHICLLSWLITCLESILHFTVAKEHKFVRAMSKRKSYNVSFKLKAVECVEKKNEEAAAREMGVDSKRIRKWCI